MKRKKPGSKQRDRQVSQGGSVQGQAGSATGNASDNDELSQAKQLLSLGRQDEALEILTRLAQAPRPSPQALSALARLRMDRQEFAEAASVFRRLLQEQPQDPGLHNSLGMALIMGGRQVEARSELEQAARLAPQEPLFQFNLAKYHMLMEDYPAARQLLEPLLPQAPAAMRDQVLGCLNQSLAHLGLPPVQASQTPAPPPAAQPAQQTRPAPASALPSPAAGSQPELEMLLCCGQGMDSFVDGLIAGLAPGVRVEKLVSQHGEDYLQAIARHDTIWIEWGNELAEFLTTKGASALKGKRVILRIHAYEVMQGQAERVNFNQVTDLMFVCAGMRDLLLERRPEVRRQVERIHVIPNGIDTARFQLATRAAGLNLAYVGYLNFKKGPMVLMHAFERLYRRDTRCRLHVAGTFQDRYSETACHHFLAQNDLQGPVRFYGWIKDIPAWLADKNAIICTSLSESQGLGLMEALSLGLKPLIYNFHTAAHIYPRQWLWNNLDELAELLYRPHDPAEGRRFVEENYSLDLQVQRLRRMLFQKEEVVFAGPRVQLAAPPPTPADCFSPSLAVRGAANRGFGLELKQAGWLKEAQVYLNRAWSQSGYQDRQSMQELLGCQLETRNLDRVARSFQEMGLAAALRADYETMLLAFSEVYYHVYKITGSYRWQEFDPAIDTVLKLIAPRVEPVPAYGELAARLDPQKRKLAMALDSFDQSWATVRRFTDIGRRVDKSRWEVIFFTRMPFNEDWRPVVQELAAAGCHLLFPQVPGIYPPIQRYLHLLRAIACDVLLLNTQFLSPAYDLLALAGAARKVVKFISQGGGRESSSDLAVSSVAGGLIDEVAEGAFIGPAYVSETPVASAPHRKPEGQLRAVCVGRLVKFNNQRFVDALLTAVHRLPQLTLDIIGCQGEQLFGAAAPPANLRFLGFRRDVMQLLPGYDLMIDTWPSGGGCTIREAHACGLPIISYRTSWHEQWKEGASFHGGFDDFIHPELLLDGCDTPGLLARLERLAGDGQYYRRIRSQCGGIKVLTPAEFAAGLQALLERISG